MSPQGTEFDAVRRAREGARREAQAVARAAEDIDEGLADVMRIVRSCRGKVFVTGSGTSGTIARRLAHLLSVTGTPSVFIQPMDALHGTMGALAGGDVLIALSKGGESSEINQLCDIAHGRGIRVIGVGEAPASSLARSVDCYVCLRTLEGADPADAIAMGSTLVTALWGDALARGLMEEDGWTLSDSLDIHPAGAVGRLARAAGTSDGGPAAPSAGAEQ